ncbi:hypothetical protein RRF57_010403 [Xylaria bambusicola]|uniref:PiggyBac transposable element-derived protein domain-containing protein n=1 Tax=Xylaria bambusicola TaxID=326684 RepID=A0AAN7UL61_9PEZI
MPKDPAKPEVDEGTLEPDLPLSTQSADPSTFKPLNLPYREFQANNLPKTPVDLFEAFLPPSLIAKWAVYIENDREKDLKAFKNDENAKKPLSHSTSLPEIYCFLASLIYIGLHKENSLRLYWSLASDRQPKHTLSLYISRNRFEDLYRHFAFWDPDYEDKGLPRLFSRVSEVSEIVRSTCKRFITIPLYITIDESMIGFTGRSRITTLVKNKPTPVGFKVWTVGFEGYVLDWLWHFNHLGPVGIPFPSKKGAKKLAEKRPTDPSEELQQLSRLNDSQQVIATLVRRLPQQPYHLFHDNLFTSVSLSTYLRVYKGVGVTATAREGSGIAKELAEEYKKDRKQDRLPWNSLKAKATPDGLIQQFIYKGNASTLFFSTVYAGDEPLVRVRRRRPNTKSGRAYFKDEGEKRVFVPAVVADYNHFKAGIDTANQLRSYNSWSHRIRRGREKCLFLQFILETVLCNTFLLQKWSGWQYKDQGSWREAVLQGLFERYGSLSKAGTRGYSEVNSFKKRPSEHSYGFRGKCSTCKACLGYDISNQKRVVLGPSSGNRGGIRRQTSYGCLDCDVALCNNSYCMYKWHQQN